MFRCLVLLALVLVTEPRLHPVILVPGDGGSQVEGRLNKTNTVHYMCDKTSDWFDLWLNLEQLIPQVRCVPAPALQVGCRWWTAGWTT